MAYSTKIRAALIKKLDPFVHNYMPRGLIFAIDLIIVFISAIAAFYLVSTITKTPYDLFHFSWPFWVVIAVQAIFFLLLKSYAGLIRYSSLNDAWKQLKVVFFCMLTLLVINQTYYIYTDQKLILNAGLIIYGVFAFSLLFLFRIVVKGMYEIIQREEKDTAAYILGTTREDVAIASGLIAQRSDTFSIIGFINTQDRPLKNSIFDLPIFSLQQLQKRRRESTAVIINEDKIRELQQCDSGILTDLLDLNFKIFKLPKLQDWRDRANSGFNDLREINIEDLLQRSPIKLDTQKLSAIYRGKTILVTGAAGSIGSEIVRQLTAFAPKRIVLLDQAETPLHQLTLEMSDQFPDTPYEKLIANVRNQHRLKQIFSRYQPEVVFHAAAYKHVPLMETNIGEAISVNFRGTRNVAELSVEYGVERFVFVSTDKAVNPTNIMGATKRAAEIFIQYISHRPKSSRTTFMTTRFGNVLGSNGSVVPHFKKQIMAGGPVTVTHPDIIRYFMTIDEACQLVLEAGGLGEGGEIFVFDMGKPVKIIDLARQMIRLSGRIPEKDIKIEFTGLRPGEKLYEELLADKEKTTKTHHEKIMIGQATFNFDHTKVNLLNTLLEVIQEYDCSKSLEILKQIVPEYNCEKRLTSEKKNIRNAG